MEIIRCAGNLRPYPVPGPIDMIVGRLQQRAKCQIAAADGDFLEDAVIVPTAL